MEEAVANISLNGRRLGEEYLDSRLRSPLRYAPREQPLRQ